MAADTPTARPTTDQFTGAAAGTAGATGGRNAGDDGRAARTFVRRGGGTRFLSGRSADGVAMTGNLLRQVDPRAAPTGTARIHKGKRGGGRFVGAVGKN